MEGLLVLIPIVGILAVFGLPTGVLVMYLRQRHREKMLQLQTQAGTSRVAQLETARADLEARVRTLETIVTAGDHDLESRLRRLSASMPDAGMPRLSDK